MPCVHLNQLFQLCRESQVHVSSSDLIRFVCRQCSQEEVCPSLLYEQYEQSPARGQDQTSAMPTPAMTTSAMPTSAAQSSTGPADSQSAASS